MKYNTYTSTTSYSFTYTYLILLALRTNARVLYREKKNCIVLNVSCSFLFFITLKRIPHYSRCPQMVSLKFRLRKKNICFPKKKIQDTK